MSLAPTTELEAINVMLSAIGEAPVSTVEDNGVVDAVVARTILRNTSREVQSRGWHWNTDKALSLVLTFPDGFAILPNNCLRIDSVNDSANIDVVQRGNRLYDRRKHTYAFEGPLTVDMVVLLAFEELPEAARNYITMRSARVFQERFIGSETLSTFNRRDELVAWSNLLNAEAETADANILTDNYSIYRVLDR